MPKKLTNNINKAIIIPIIYFIGINFNLKQKYTATIEIIN